MSKRNKIIYWVATLWLSLGMSSAGIVQIMRIEDEIKLFDSIQFPLYMLPFLGSLKLLGVITILLPKTPVLKEWAYAGFFFTALGAVFAHIMTGHSFGEIAPLFLFFILIGTSWHFRPADKKPSPSVQ
jgi:hypothetical protein